MEIAAIIAIVVGLSGIAIIKLAGWFFDHKSGQAKSVGAAGVLFGFGLIVVGLVILSVVRIQHLFR